MFDVLSILAMALLGHALASLTQNLLHRWLGHAAAGGALQRIHQEMHHTIYTAARMCSRRYDDAETTLTPLYLIPAFALAGLFLWLAPLSLAIAFALGLAASFATQVYVHAQYHVRGSWLQRYRWFRRGRLLHAAHHRDTTKNFGLIDHSWDRLFGTFFDPRRNAP